MLLKKIFCLILLIVLSGCKNAQINEKEDTDDIMDKLPQCYTEENKVSRSVSEPWGTIEEMYDYSENIVIAKLEAPIDEEELDLFDISVIHTVKSDSIPIEKAKILITCDEYNNTIVEDYTNIPNEFAIGDIEIGYYYLLLFNTTSSNNKYVTGFYKLEGYDDNLEYNKQSTEINDVISTYEGISSQRQQ